MKNHQLIIYYSGSPIAVTPYDPSNIPGMMPSDVLDWYAPTYGFDRKSLTYSIVPAVENGYALQRLQERAGHIADVAMRNFLVRHSNVPYNEPEVIIAWNASEGEDVRCLFVIRSTRQDTQSQEMLCIRVIGKDRPDLMPANLSVIVDKRLPMDALVLGDSSSSSS